MSVPPVAFVLKDAFDAARRRISENFPPEALDHAPGDAWPVIAAIGTLAAHPDETHLRRILGVRRRRRGEDGAGPEDGEGHAAALAIAGSRASDRRSTRNCPLAPSLGRVALHAPNFGRVGSRPSTGPPGRQPCG
jgi:hypothetical protein